MIHKLINHIVNNIRLTQNLTYILRALITCNSIIRFSKEQNLAIKLVVA